VPTLCGRCSTLRAAPAAAKRPRARRWSQAIYAAYPNVEGLLYGSSMNANQPTVAFYERARAALPPAPCFHRALNDATLLRRFSRAASQIGYRIV
jgi:hypothetical protein